MRSGLEDSPWATIVGVIENTRAVGLETEPGPEMFFHYLQIVKPYLFFVEGTGTLLLRTATNPSTLANAVRQTVREVDPEHADRDPPVA